MQNENEKLGAFAYLIAGLSFFPFLGLIFGAITTMWGLNTQKAGGKRLAMIGTIGMWCSILLPAAFFYWFIWTHPDEYHRLR